jgi:hypothetical protein
MLNLRMSITAQGRWFGEQHKTFRNNPLSGEVRFAEIFLEYSAAVFPGKFSNLIFFDEIKVWVIQNRGWEFVQKNV